MKKSNFNFDKITEICNKCISDAKSFILDFPKIIDPSLGKDMFKNFDDNDQTLLSSKWNIYFIEDNNDYEVTGLEIFCILKIIHKMRVRMDENAKILTEKGINKASFQMKLQFTSDEFNCKSFYTYLSLCRIAIMPPSLDSGTYKKEDEPC